MAANTLAGEVEKLLPSYVFRLLLSAIEEKERHQSNGGSKSDAATPERSLGRTTTRSPAN